MCCGRSLFCLVGLKVVCVGGCFVCCCLVSMRVVSWFIRVRLVLVLVVC